MLQRILIQQVGEARYRRSCAVLREAAERPDLGSDTRDRDDDAWQVPHDLADALFDSAAPPIDTIRTLFELYDELPAYGLVMYASGQHYAAWPAAARRAFWEAVIARLAGDDEARARPLAYTLWCDWFEGEDVLEAWEALTGADIPPRVLEHVLELSGPVPWRAKTALYARLLGTPHWHHYIFRSILRSVFDVYGKHRRAEARAWLQRLELPSTTEHLATLQAKLASGPSKVLSWVRSRFERASAR